jgi:protein-S-isoprenylcysteine O-methyltransferase Ste14
MRNVYPRLLLLALPALILIKYRSFVQHISYFLSGDVSQTLIQENWWLVAANIVLFLGFLALLNVRRRMDWSPSHVGGIGVYVAFIVSLFVEMYGVPLTIFLGSGLIGGVQQPPATLLTVTLPGVTLSMNLWMVVGAFITLVGMHLVAIGWWQVYTADGLVTDGLYAYSRNPQYLGIILIAFGWMLHWPTILTVILFPVLAYAYYRLARLETADMHEEYGDTFTTYADRVPLLI